MSKKKKESIMIIAGFAVVCYLLFALFIIHVLIAMETPGIESTNPLATGWDDMLGHPFRIFPLPKNTMSTLFVGTLLAAILGILLYITEAQKKHYNPDTVNGDAKWLTELDKYNKRFSDPVGSTSKDGPYNMILSQDIYMCLDNQSIRRNMNVLVIGGSGSGKTYTLVGPNLMQANTSYVITDPSGGLFKEYGYFFEYYGYKVKCFNLDHMERGNHYNPFNYIHGNKDIEILVTTLISNTTPPDQKSSEPFWEKSETVLLVALIAYLYNYTAKSAQNFSNVMRLMRAADVDENDSSAKSPLDYIFEKVEKADPDSFAVNQYKTFKKGAGKTLKSILISCLVRLQAFDLPEVADLTDTDDIDLDSVGDEKTALFVIIPTGEKTFNFLASMMYSQLFQRTYGYCENTAEFSQLIIDSDRQVWKTFRAESAADKTRARAEAESYFERAKKAKISQSREYGWYEMRTDRGELVGYRGSKEEAEHALEKLRKGKVISNSEQSNHGQRLPIHTRLMLDEFANTGKIPEFSEKVATMRKYDISVTIILQSLLQLKNLYKDDWETISGNCDNTVYLGGGADTTTTEWISKLLGKETRVVMNTTFSGKSGGSTSLNRTGVELFSPDQLRTMDENDCVIIPNRLYAFKGKKFPSDKHPRRALVKELEKTHGAYWYNPQKSADLLAEMRPPEHEITDKHGEVVEEDEETVARKNEDAEQIAQEFANNEDANGDAIVGDAKVVQATGDGLDETVPLTTKEEVNAATNATFDTNDELWGPEEIIFGSAPADVST